MDKKQTLEDIFNDDVFGVLNEPDAKYSNVKSEDERLIASFQEINAFFEKNNREPRKTSITERKLLFRLNALRQDVKKIEVLKAYDTYNLLRPEEKVTSVADILNDDDFGLLDTEETQSIFKLKNVPTADERAEADFTARRKPMKEEEFSEYEPLFKQIHEDLRVGTRKLVNFNHEALKPNEFYINNGVLLYLENVDWEKEVQEFNSGIHNRPDGRTRIIFENGTWSRMMFQSLYKVLHFNGQMVTNPDYLIEDELFKNSNIVNEDDVETGWIYVLKSRSSQPEIASLKNLYKIGYSNVEVNQRIKNAANEPTYLNAGVQIISTFKCYNINPQKFEALLHRFFADVCLDIDITDTTGRRNTPREWFVVPLPIIDRVIHLILSGEILNYRYDRKAQVILNK